MITVICMRTTLDFDDRLIREAKVRAAEEGETLTRAIENALRAYLRPGGDPGRPFRLRPLTKKGRAHPGVHLDDRDALYELMEGRS
jgi:hypothetical protein